MLKRITYGYQIVKKRTGPNFKPLPNMLQYFLNDHHGKQISFWNDVPINLKADTVTCTVEIPKEYQGKFQVKKFIPNHAFMQDTRKNRFTNEIQLRFYAQFPLFNYGFIPQTWQQNVIKNSEGLCGDDDPLDICDLSMREKKVGQIFEGKVLGSFCLIDQGEIDWKILTMDAKECQENNIKSIEDISSRRIESIKKWFKGIKVFDGKKANTIHFNEKVFGRDQSLAVINEGFQEWKNLLSNQKAAYEQIRNKYHIKRVVNFE